MREHDGLPDWALKHLRKRVPEAGRLLNAVALRSGFFEGMVLVNTVDGAALVTKGLVGGTQSVVLTYPAETSAFRCLSCGAMNAPSLSALEKGAACIACGVRHRLTRTDGATARPRRTAGKTRRRTASSKGTTKRKAKRTTKRKATRRSGPYRKGPYTLYAREVTSKGGKRTTFYFFSKGSPKSGRPSRMPKGYEVTVTKRSGLPVLRRSKAGTPKKRTAAAASRKKASSRAKAAKSTKLAATTRRKKAADPKYRPQCRAITKDGKQCKNSARKGSHYCGSHKGYQPPAPGANIYHKDTTPKVGKARDTLPKVRKPRRTTTAAST